MVVAAAAADGVAAEYVRRTGEYMTLAIPPLRWAGLLGRWLFYGSLGAVLSAVTALLVLMALPADVRTRLRAGVGAGRPRTPIALDDSGLRVLYRGAGVGIGAALKAPASGDRTVFFWAYAVGGAVAYLPSAASLQRFMPLINAICKAGQETALDPPWGKNVTALAYVGALCVAAFECGGVRFCGCGSLGKEKREMMEDQRLPLAEAVGCRSPGTGCWHDWGSGCCAQGDSS